MDLLFPRGLKETTSFSVPSRPNRPQNPYQYTGLRLKETNETVFPASNEVLIKQNGGAGQTTVGILKLSGGAKSFGVFG